MSQFPLWEGVRQLLLPDYCAGCGSPGEIWCATCQSHLSGPPRRIHTRVHTIAPIWALAPYSGPVAEGIVDLKEHRRRSLVPYFGAALAGGIGQLIQAGNLLGPHYHPLLLVPAPSTIESLRMRGFPHTREIAEACAQTVSAMMKEQGADYPVAVGDILRIASHPDSVGLTANQRQEALAGTVTVPPSWQIACMSTTQSEERPFDTSKGEGYCPTADLAYWREQKSEIVVIDDVVTTGVTVSECFLALSHTGLRLRGALIVSTA